METRGNGGRRRNMGVGRRRYIGGRRRYSMVRESQCSQGGSNRQYSKPEDDEFTASYRTFLKGGLMGRLTGTTPAVQREG